jgi:hypothetical protein
VKAAADTGVSLKRIQNLYTKRLQRTICVLEDLCALPDLSELKFVHVVVSLASACILLKASTHGHEYKAVQHGLHKHPLEMCALTVEHTGAEDDSRWHPQPCVGCQHGEEYVQVDL